MNQRRRALLFAILVGLACWAGVNVRGLSPVRVLFIGNSYTYFHNLPEVFAQLASAGRQPVETGMVAPGGWRLKDHWEKGEARKVLSDRRWNYVVLQDQSTLGVTLLVEGNARVSSDEIFRPAADMWAAEIRKAGAMPVFYLTWARKASPEDQDTLVHAYMSAARASRGLVSPVGLAWQLVRQDRPEVELFEKDGSHPSPNGTYLAACTFFAAVFDKDPTGLPEVVRGAPVDLETEKVQAGKIAPLVTLPREHARILQQAAWRAWQEVKKSGGYVDAKPVKPGLAALPPPVKVSSAGLAGRWSGTLLMHPSGPVEMALRIENAAAGWSGHVELKWTEPESATLADVRVGDGEARFTLPKSAALAGLPVQFHGVSVSPTELRGRAEAVGGDPGEPLRLLGSWRVTRQ